MARRSLDAMAAGGIYDQLGGGFARYSRTTLARTALRKMLYDNALFARAYTHRVAGDPRRALTGKSSSRPWSSCAAR
jgi:uncharacterized protein YyaL (SSP411 family)